MRKFTLDTKKYGFELFMDMYKYGENPGAFFLPTVHTGDFFEIFILEKAKGSIDLNGHAINFGNHTAFFVSPFQKKSWKLDISKTKGFHLVFQDAFFSDFFEDKLFVYRMQYFYNSQFAQFLQLTKEEFKLIKALLNEVSNELKNFKSDSKHIIRSLLYFVLTKFNRLYINNYNLPTETQGDSLIYKFKESLEHNIRKFHAVDDYCDILHVQRHKLNRIVKLHFGNTAMDTIHLRLLQEIKMELIYSDKTILEIASELNFSEANNLTRFFNRLEGIAPTVFREKFQIDSHLS